MRRPVTAYIKSLRPRRVLFACAAMVLLLILLAVALAASLPVLLSTPQVQSLVRLRLSSSMKRPVTWSALTVSWSRGIALSGLSLGEGAAPLLSASVGELRLVPALSRDAQGRFVVAIDLTVKKVQARLAPGPKKEKPPAKDPLTQVAEAVQGFQKMEWPLPADLRLAVDVSPVNVTYLDPAAGRNLHLRDVVFRLAVPSLTRLPVETSLNGTVALGDSRPERIEFSAGISELVAANRVKPAGARFSARAALPGARFELAGGVTRPEGLAAKLDLTLAELAPVAAGLVQRPLPGLSGKVALDLEGRTDQRGDLALSLQVAGASVAARLKGKGTAGPLDLTFRQKLVSDHERQRVSFSDGSLVSPGLFAASWQASVDRPTEPSRELSFRLAPFSVDLARARAVAAPFLPPDLPVRELKGTATVGAVEARLKGPDNDGSLSVERAGVDLPKLALRLKDGDLLAEGLSFTLGKAFLPLTKGRPSRLTADVGVAVARLELGGKKPVSLRGGKGRLDLAVEELDLREMRAAVRVKQWLELKEAKLGADLAADGVRQELELDARALGGGEVAASLPKLRVTAAGVRAAGGGRNVTLRPVAAALSAEGVRVPAKGKGNPTVRRGTLSLTAADALAIEAEGGISGLAREQAATKGSVRLDLGRIMPIAAPFLPAGFAASGKAGASWDLSLPLPVAKLTKNENPLAAGKGALALLERADLALELSGVDLKLPSGQGTLQLKNLGTAPGLRIVLPRPGAPLAIGGGLRFDEARGLPGNAGKLPLKGGALTLEGELDQWKALRLTEELKVASLGLSQVAELTVERLDTLLEPGVRLDKATLLKRLDATMFAHLEGDFPREAKPLYAGVLLSGNVSAGARLDLTAAKELRVRGYAKCRDFGLSDAKGMNVSGVRADLVVDRSYALAQGKGEDWVPLSARLVRPAPVARERGRTTDLAARIYDDLRGEISGPRKIGVTRATFASGAYPVEASALEADLLLEPESLGLSFLQTELAGGTVRARGVIDLSREVPVLTTFLNFSRLDPAILFPAPGGARPGEEGELTGELSLAAPLAADRRALLEGMRLNLNLRRFSSRILDRALYAMDPYQRNEKVVAQRKSLKLADLKGLRVSAVDGALDCEGELLVKGVAVEIPRIERLRLSELPIEKELKRVAAAIASSRTLLDLVRADTLVVGPKGELALKRRKQ